MDPSSTRTRASPCGRSTTPSSPGCRTPSATTASRPGVIVCGLRDRRESASPGPGRAGGELPRARACWASTSRAARAATPPRCTARPSTSHGRNCSTSPSTRARASARRRIRQALFKCGAHRIGHGVTLGQDPELLRYFVDRQIPLEICPTSNVQTHVVASYEAHPVAEYVRAGVPVTINTDNRLFSHTTVTDELWLAHTRCGIPADALREIVLNGFRFAFLPGPRSRRSSPRSPPSSRAKPPLLDYAFSPRASGASPPVASGGMQPRRRPGACGARGSGCGRQRLRPAGVARGGTRAGLRSRGCGLRQCRDAPREGPRGRTE